MSVCEKVPLIDTKDIFLQAAAKSGKKNEDHVVLKCGTGLGVGEFRKPLPKLLGVGKQELW